VQTVPFLADWADGEGPSPLEVEEVAESDPGPAEEIPPPHPPLQDVWRWSRPTDSDILAWLASSGPASQTYVGPGQIDQWDLARDNSDVGTPSWTLTTNTSSGEGFLADWAAGEES